MGMVAPQQRIASSFVVLFGNYGAVSQHARQEGISRQVVYQRAAQTVQLLEGQRHRDEVAHWQQRCGALEQRCADLESRLARAVVLDKDKQAEFATVGQALGVSLPACRELLDLLIPGEVASVATLGRWTQAAAVKAGQLLQVLDAAARERVRAVAADEIYVKAPVLMMVEPESLCWVAGQLSTEASGAAWLEQFRQLPQLEQVTRDGGTGLAKGIALLNEERQEQGQAAVVDQGDHFHALRHGGVALRQAERRASRALAQAEAAQKELEDCQRQGRDARGASQRARCAWQGAEQALDTWTQREQAWQQVKESLRLVTPAGECNQRGPAEAALAEALAQLPDGEFAKTKRALAQPEMLSYLDQVQQRLAALEAPAEVKAAAIRQECLRRRLELLAGDSAQASALRGVMLVCALVLARSGTVGQQTLEAVRGIFRTAYRASSLVECINSALRMQQARHRKLTQGLLDLKRLYWNCHTFRTGRRRHTSPYQRLGIAWPEGKRWWEILKRRPEQLKAELSAVKTAE